MSSAASWSTWCSRAWVRQTPLALFGKLEHCPRRPLWLQVRMQEYNQIKSQLGQISRKQTGSLAVRDLSAVTQGKDFVNTENLVTLFVVVSKHTKGDWLTNYEKLCEFVVSICGACLGLPAALHDEPCCNVVPPGAFSPCLGLHRLHASLLLA